MCRRTRSETEVSRYHDPPCCRVYVLTSSSSLTMRWFWSVVLKRVSWWSEIWETHSSSTTGPDIGTRCVLSDHEAPCDDDDDDDDVHACSHFPLFFDFWFHLQKLRELASLPLSVHLDPPCTNSTPSTLYLNNPIVRAALHINPRALNWSICR